MELFDLLYFTMQMEGLKQGILRAFFAARESINK